VPARLPSASLLARRLLLLLAMELLGALVLEKKSLDWQRLGKQRAWWKARGTRSSNLWDWKRDHGRRSLRISHEIWEVERLPQPSRRRVFWDSSWVIFCLTSWNPTVLRSGCFSGMTLFGQGCRVAQELLIKIRQDKYGKIKTDEEQNYRDDKAFGYKLFVTIIHPSILRLH
jgi:hypothetical protein